MYIYILLYYLLNINLFIYIHKPYYIAHDIVPIDCLSLAYRVPTTAVGPWAARTPMGHRRLCREAWAARTATGHRCRRGAWGRPHRNKPSRPWGLEPPRPQRGLGWGGHPQRVPIKFTAHKKKTELRETAKNHDFTMNLPTN